MEMQKYTKTTAIRGGGEKILTTLDTIKKT
jgi:hypothetical protein